MSRSGYYKWVKEKELRQQREERDRHDFDLILKAYNMHGYTKGARGIQMALLHCWDNAPQESFYGHMKDEIGDKITKCKTFNQISKVIVDYMNYYNYHRYQWDLAKLSPAEYYEYCTTGIYPLPKGNDKNPE